jgi:predicted TPR repeat methyltransferase
MNINISSADPIVKRLQTVQHLIDSEKLQEAAERLQTVAKSAPGDPRVYLIGMRLADAAGQPKKAEDAARRAVQLTPLWPVAVVELALLLARQNRFDEAIVEAQKALKLASDSQEVVARVIEIAQRAQRWDLSIPWLLHAESMQPDNLKIRRLLARDLRNAGDHAKAVAIYDVILGAVPADAESLLGRAQALVTLGDLERAAADTQALLARDASKEEYAYWNELAQGRTPARQPVEMVRTMYEGMAGTFDQRLVAGLKYKLPRDVGAKIRELYPDNKLNVLDLGCGTGLLGACLGRIDGFLIGVELSPAMIEQAARHGVYDRFHNVDLLDALRETPASLYDVIAALDVLIYVGDLSAAIQDAHRVLRDGGHFIFSCETAAEDEADLVLRPSQRFAHKASHVQAMCRAAGFADVTLEPMTLRYEGPEPVQGFLVIASKAA